MSLSSSTSSLPITCSSPPSADSDADSGTKSERIGINYSPRPQLDRSVTLQDITTRLTRPRTPSLNARLGRCGTPTYRPSLETYEIAQSPVLPRVTRPISIPGLETRPDTPRRDDLSDSQDAEDDNGSKHWYPRTEFDLDLELDLDRSGGYHALFDDPPSLIVTETQVSPAPGGSGNATANVQAVDNGGGKTAEKAATAENNSSGSSGKGDGKISRRESGSGYSSLRSSRDDSPASGTGSGNPEKHPAGGSSGTSSSVRQTELHSSVSWC